MLALLAFAALVKTPVVEVPDRSADRVTLQAVFKLPKTDALNRAALDVLSQVVVDDNDAYSKPQMQALCAPGGEPRCYVLPDTISISLAVLPADEGLGLRILAGMLSSPRFNLDTINSYLISEPARHHADWAMALDGSTRAWDRLRMEDVTNLFRTVFRPDNMVLGVGGPLARGLAETEWARVSASWRRQPAKPLRSSEPFKDFAQPYRSHILELRGPEWDAHEPLGARLLALVALGGGKGSALFQVIREQLALSYRQEAALWPTRDGFVGRILVQTSPKPAAEEQEELRMIRAALLDAVSKWTEEDLARAKGYAWAMVDQGVPNGILYLRPTGPLGPTLEHRTFLAAYMRSKTDLPWDRGALAAEIGAVDLGTLKKVSTELLSAAMPLLHPAQPEKE